MLETHEHTYIPTLVRKLLRNTDRNAFTCACKRGGGERERDKLIFTELTHPH